MGRRKEAEPRACGYCTKTTNPPHNSRTCPKKKADTALGPFAGAPPVAEAPPTTTVTHVPTPIQVDVNAPVSAAEFEELRKQVQLANGQAMVGSLRTYEGGWTQFVLRSPGADPSTPTEQVFDIEKARKLYELLGWCLQQHQAQASKPIPGVILRAPTNGLPTRPSAEGPSA